MSLRKFIRRGIGLLGFLWFVSVYAYPIPDSIAVRLQGFVSALEQFGKALPQEKVYLHFEIPAIIRAIRFGFSVMS